jgi:cell division septum initiation protein DivIVA
MPDDVRQIILDTIEASLEAQLSAVRRLRSKKSKLEESLPEKRRSNLSIVFDILKTEEQPLHSSEIIKRAQTLFGRHLDRESLVSALTKCVARKDRFSRPAPNTFALLPGAEKEEPTAS